MLMAIVTRREFWDRLELALYGKTGNTFGAATALGIDALYDDLVAQPAPATVTRERELLRELVALVRGECPSLLNEDSGGDARLSMAIDAALASPPAEDVQFARDVHMLARRIVVRPERAAELAPHLMRLAERRGALAPGVLRDDEWTPASALSKAYPPSGMIEPGDVIEFAHGNDAPMLQRLTHPAAVEDWNGKLRDRVRQVYTPKAQAPPASDPPSMPEPSPARAGYPYTDAGDRVMAERFPASDQPGPTVINEDDGDVTIDFDYANDRVVSIRLGEESSGLSAFVDGESHALCPLDRVPPKVLALLRTEAKAVTLRQSDPPGLVDVVRAWQEARTARMELFKKWECDEYRPAPFDEVSSISFRMDEATKALDAYPLPASPQAKED